MTNKVNTKNLVPDNLSDITKTGNFMNKKSERLASAVYLVTEYLSDNDPIKWKARQLALEIMSHMLVISQKDTSEDMRRGLVDFSSISLRIKEILSLIEVALSSASVSQMNFSLLRGEYLKLLSLLERFNDSSYGESFLFTEDSSQLIDTPKIQSKTEKESGQINNNLAYPEQRENSIKDSSKRHNMSYKNVAKTAGLNSDETLLNKSKRQLTKNERKNKIILFLKDKDWVSIKDISELISEVSTKTIQRELNVLVETNVLNKKGERRWSRYRLNER